MTTVIRVSALAVAALLMSSTSASAQNWGRPQTPQSGACFYEDVNYGGDYFCAAAGSNNSLVNYRLNNKISSIRLFGNAQVTVYVDQDFRGKSRTVGSDLNDLRRGGWNDRITSFRVRSAGPGSGEWHGRWGRPSTPSAGACFYEHINFEGQYFCVREGDRIEMVPEGTNDRISSMRLFGGAEITVFRDRDFSGASQHFQGDARDLRDSGWNDTISSFRVETSGYGRANRGRGQGQGQGRGQGQGPRAEQRHSSRDRPGDRQAGVARSSRCSRPARRAWPIDRTANDLGFGDAERSFVVHIRPAGRTGSRDRLETFRARYGAGDSAARTNQ